jgi:hypothetical protein
MEATQFCIAMKNKPGVLGALCASLRAAGVNVDALYVAGDDDCCWVNFVAGPVRQATETLAAEGHNFFTERVLVLRVPDEPGALERVSLRLAEADININYVYGSCTGGACTLVLNVDEVDQAAKVLED